MNYCTVKVAVSLRETNAHLAERDGYRADIVHYFLVPQNQ